MRGDMREARDGSPHRPRPRRSASYRDGEQTQPRAVRRDEPPPMLPMPRQVPRWGVYWLRFGAAMVFAAFVPLVLAQLGLAAGIASELSAIGFDAERVLLIEFALVACVGALAAGIALRWRAPVWLGSLLYYVFGYLLPFIGQAQHPALGPDGTPQVLLPGAFAATIATLLAAGILFSGMGAVLGEASGRVFMTPLVVLGRFILVRGGSRRGAAATPGSVPAALSALAVGVVLITAFALVVANLDSILNYGTTTALYQPARVAALHGTVKQGAYPSPALGGRLRAYLIYLPPSYTALPQQRYPVIYLLHGNPGHVSNWFSGAHADTTANFLIAAGKIRQVIIVAPDGNGPVYPVSEWANSFDGRQHMEDSIAHDLVHYIDAHYRTLANPAHRAIGGLSEGGYAAANIALHHPDVFGTALSLSGFFHVIGGQIFGVGTASSAYREYNSPDTFVTTPLGVEAAHRLTFIIGVGTQDHQYYPVATAFYRELRLYGVHADLLQAPGGHSWQLWASQFAQALPIMEPPTVTVASPHRSAG